MISATTLFSLCSNSQRVRRRRRQWETGRLLVLRPQDNIDSSGVMKVQACAEYLDCADPRSPTKSYLQLAIYHLLRLGTIARTSRRLRYPVVALCQTPPLQHKVPSIPVACRAYFQTLPIVVEAASRPRVHDCSSVLGHLPRTAQL